MSQLICSNCDNEIQDANIDYDNDADLDGEEMVGSCHIEAYCINCGETMELDVRTSINSLSEAKQRLIDN